MEIMRFGPGHRRAAPPMGTEGLADQVIWGDPRARVTELAFSRRGAVAPRTSPELGLFVVVSGGGFVRVGDERIPIRHGQAVEWPPNIPHGAWTDGSEMRAILIELPDVAVEATPVRVTAGEERPEAAARGTLAERAALPSEHDESEGEPW